MKQICDNIFIGNDCDCAHQFNNPEISIIHACKTCHQRALMYRRPLPQDHPNYLILRKDNHLYLNMVDAPIEFLPRFAHPMFAAAMEFIGNRPVLIHCNQGRSRSASIAMLYMAIQNKIPQSSYADAAREFALMYPEFAPGDGIRKYMQNNWDYLIRLKA